MPPKPAKPGGKKKKTKAEIEAERLQAEEDARKAEELRIKREEEERRKAEEAARLLDETRAAQRVQELARLSEELSVAEESRALGMGALALEDRLEQEEKDWELYKACNPQPRAATDREINTYLSEQEDEEVTDMYQALMRCEYTERIAADLLTVMGQALANGNKEKVASSKKFLQRLRNCSDAKIDFATAHLLTHWDDCVQGGEVGGGHDDADKYCKTLAGIRVGLWCNFTQKGGRMKTIEFVEAGMSTDIYRPLSTARVALRNMFVPYERIPAHFIKEGSSPEDVIKQRRMVLGGIFHLELLVLPPGVKKMAGWTFRPMGELTKSVKRHTYPLDGGNASVAPALRAQFTVPEGVLIPENPAVCGWDVDQGCWTEDLIAEVEWHKDKRLIRFHTQRVGLLAVVQSRVKDLPYKSWRIRPIYDPSASADLLTVPEETINTEKSQQPATLQRNKDGSSDEYYNNMNTSTMNGVNGGGVGMDADIDILENEESIAASIQMEPELAIELETPRLLIELRVRGRVAWLKEVKTSGTAAATPNPSSTSSIGGTPNPNSNPNVALTELNLLQGVQMVPGDLVLALEKAGINIAPTREDADEIASAQVQKKIEEFEDLVCQQIAAVSAAFEVKSSKWNGTLGPERCAVQIRESSAFTGDNDDLIDFKIAVLECDSASDTARYAPSAGCMPLPTIKSSLVRGWEREETSKPVSSTASLDTTPHDGEVPHIQLLECLKSTATTEAVERAELAGHIFQRTVYQLLSLIRPFSCG